MPTQDGRDLFAGTAYYYARYRPQYPQEFLQHIVARFELDGTGRLLDLGCGTGELALPLAAHVAEVVGVDPEPAMLAEAAAKAERLRVKNVVWIEGSSRDLSRLGPRLAPLRLVVMGRSFHWMEPDATLAELAGMVEPGGGVVMAGEPCNVWGGERDWQRAVRAVIQRWLGEARRAGSGAYSQTHDPWSDVLARSAFSRIEAYSQTYTWQWDIDRITGFLYSTSFASPSVLGDRRAGFERDLRATLLAMNPAGIFEEELQLEGFLAWRE
jgi:ubiquinone/menaquinone biosynthesis C-methylase UbiE